MKKIYLLIECIGQYEDRTETVVKAYESEKDAIFAKGELMAKAIEEYGGKVYKCMDCPHACLNEEPFSGEPTYYIQAIDLIKAKNP